MPANTNTRPPHRTPPEGILLPHLQFASRLTNPSYAGPAGCPFPPELPDTPGRRAARGDARPPPIRGAGGRPPLDGSTACFPRKDPKIPKRRDTATKSIDPAAVFRFLPLVRAFLITVAVLLLAALAAGGYLAWRWVTVWTTTASPLAASGGLYFPRTVLHDVPHFAQADRRWADDRLGPTRGSLGAEGCAVASAAMVLAAYGADLDPGRLNRFLQSNGGFTERGWLYWEKASEYPPAIAEHVYEDDASHFLIDWNLLRGNPVIVRLRFPDGITHFVVIVGKRGYEYLIRDPGPRHVDGLYFLSDFGSPIEALRFYRPFDTTSRGHTAGPGELP